MTSANDLEALIRHAEAYPYERPTGSYLYDGGAVRPLGRLRLAGRVPVTTTIPVTRARLRDNAVVYAAHLSRVPTMFSRSRLAS